MSIKKMTGTITCITDLSKTAKDVTITLPEEINFIAGHFVNIFMDIEGEKVRRAFSVSSSDSDQKNITLSIRKSQNGVISPLFWERDQTGTVLEIMGPLGVNIAHKLTAENVYLFAYGVGAGVVKSILDHVLRVSHAKKIILITGSRSEDEILHRTYFDTLAQEHPNLEVRHVVSTETDSDTLRKGYIQDRIDGIDFSGADIYACGQSVACDALVAKIRMQNPERCNFFIEAFH